MINKLVAALLILCLSACLSKKNSVTEEFSESGLAYTLVNMPNNTRITIRVAWPSNWAFNTERNQAVPYVGTELLFAGGAVGYEAGELVERLSDLNAEVFLSATISHILGTIHFSPEHQQEAIKAANAHLITPFLNEQWMERTRDQFSARMNDAGSSAEAKGFDALRWALFGQQSMRQALSLNEESVITSVTRAEIAAWVSSVFKRNGATIIIAGDLTANEAGAAVDALFEGVPNGELTAVETAAADFSARRILLHVPDSSTSTLSFVGKLPPLTGVAELEDILLTVAMTEHWKNGLPLADNDELAESYRFSADFSAFTADHRFILLTGQVDTSNIAEAEMQLRKAYSEFRTNLPIDDLQKLKEPYSQNYKKYLKNSGSMSNSALMAKLNGMDPVRSIEFLDELDSVNKKTLSRRLQTAFPNVDDFIVLVNSPDKAALPDACVITKPSDAHGC